MSHELLVSHELLDVALDSRLTRLLQESLDAFERHSLAFYGGDGGEFADVLQWLVLLEGTSSPQCLSCSPGAGELLAAKLLGHEFVNKVKGDAQFKQQVLERKNQARAKAHVLHEQEREWALHERLHRSQETFGIDEELCNRGIDTVQHLLQRLLADFARDESLLALMRGLHRYLVVQQEPANLTRCICVQVGIDSLAQRSNAVQTSFADYLYAICRLVTGDGDKERRVCVWRIKALVSNRTLSSLARQLSVAITSKRLDLRRGTLDDQVICLCDSDDVGIGQRVNADGVRDMEPSPCKTLLLCGSFCF